jgi:hypothetical protein
LIFNIGYVTFEILLINKSNAHDGLGSGDNERGDEDNGLYKVNKQNKR